MKQLTVINQNGQLLVDSREVAEMVSIGHDDLLKRIRGYVAILNKNSHSEKLPSENFFIESEYKNSRNQIYPCYLLTKKGCDMVANKMTGEKGVLFTAAYVTKFEEMERGMYATEQPVQIQSFQMQLIGVEYSSKILRVDETSKIRMLEMAHKQHGVPTNHLPVYVDEEVTKPLTDLLKEYNVGLSAIKFNKLLMEKGLLEEKERRSSNGSTKKFKSLTSETYGKNLINPRSPKETQPHYYESKFIDLLKLVGVSQAAVI